MFYPEVKNSKFPSRANKKYCIGIGFCINGNGVKIALTKENCKPIPAYSSNLRSVLHLLTETNEIPRKNLHDRESSPLDLRDAV